nr:peptidylprolyl isomerase [Bacillus alkalicola]
MILSHLVLEHHIGHVGDASEEQLREEYELGEEVEARHILVEEEEEAQELIDRIQAGEDFDALAREYSIEPGAEESGGNLGFFRRGQMLAPFEEAAFGLEVGELSEPVRSFYGYHVIEVTDRNPFTDDFEEVERILETAFNNRKAHKMSQKQQELFQDLEINVLDEQYSELVEE